MNLLRSICCLFGGRCAEEEGPPKKLGEVKQPAIDAVKRAGPQELTGRN
jgi:hypothetical protein